ncbi:MAG TPA: nitrite reductase small subunit NirD [Burkholderiales bacterium]|nr:nitrite reductase small subunit NirD [Burkholderiales bacterium]
MKPFRACRLEDILPGAGVCALLDGRQVAIFRLPDDRVHALGNLDPFSKANVLSRGIVGDVRGEAVVASPVYKQHFSLRTGQCLEDAAVGVPAYPARVEDGFVVVEMPAPEVATVCSYCGVGCGVLAKVDGHRITAVRGDPAHPANLGHLCSKGVSLHRADPAFRGLFPEVRGERATWDEALGFASAAFRKIIEAHGPDAVAFYISGQLLTEDYYVFNKLAKGLIGTNNIDTNSRLCMASAVAGYKQTLGADAPPACYDDLEQAECVFIAGSNTAWAHPVLYRRLEAAKPKHVVVVDPRRTETARAATLHLQVAPGTDVALFNGMLHVMRSEGWIDAEFVRAHTEGFEGLAGLPPGEAAAICGIAEKDLREAAWLFASSRATLSLYCQGLNQSSSGTAKNAALINLHLASGQIGKPGAGPFSLTGQPNAMGGREVGGMANLLSAHRDLASESDRREVAALWGVESVPAKPGRTAVEMFEAIRQGEIKAVWIACTNPAHSLPDQAAVREALERAELVVVQDAYRNTETAAFADVFLPAAGWGEKEGTMTNSERRIARVRAAVRPPGEARPDWEIAVRFAHLLCPGKKPLMSYATAEAVFNEHRETTRGRDLDITGLSYALLDERGPQQWPFPEGATEGRRRLYEDGVFPTPSGRARFVPTPHRAVAEDVSARFPLRLTTGRLRDQWHTMSRTGTIARLFGHEPEPRIQLHPEDLSSLGIGEGELVRVASPRGEAYFQAAADADMPRGTAFVAMHWGRRFLGRGVNELTLGALDPVSRQPELKHCAIRVEPANLAWRFVASGFPKDVAALFDALEFAMADTPYAARTLIGRERAGVRLSLAAAQPVSVERIQQLFREHAGDTASYADTARGRVLCNCFDVAEADVEAFLRTSRSMDALQAALKCGTSCGSCLPEVRRKIAA